MKTEIIKNWKFGALAAGASLFLVACDGDDGAQGPPGEDGNRDLTNEDLVNSAFIASQLRMTLDPNTDVLYPGTPEVYFDFSSDQLAFYNGALGQAEGLLINQETTFGPGPGNLLYQVRIVDLVANGDGMFYIDEIVGDTNDDGTITLTGPGRDFPAFAESTFTVTQIIQNTYLGTFTTLVGLEETGVTLSQNAPAVVNPAELPNPPAGYTYVDAQQQVTGGGLPVIVQTNTDVRTNVLTLAPSVIAVRFRKIGGTPETDIVFAFNSPVNPRGNGDNTHDLSGYTFDVDEVVVAGDFVSSNIPQRIIVEADAVFATGQFRLDIDSTQGGDTGFLPFN